MNFNKQQKEAINTIDGNISVIATAGSGKTTVLTYRIKNMVENHNISPSSILAVTFSKKAKENIEKKLEKLDIYDVNIETFHSLALKIIGSAYGVRSYKVWTAPWEKEKTLQNICTTLGLCNQDDVPYNDIFSFISKQKVNMLKPTDELMYGNELPFKNEDMKRIFISYEKEKENKSYIEFDDFLNMANDTLNINADILSLYQSKFKHVLVDEFQDVSMSQALLLKKLNTTNTMIVGDPLQAIYSFRGGDSKYILNFDEEYKDTKVINLNTNYRCSKDIIVTSNTLASTISDSKHKNYMRSVSDKSAYKKPELYHLDDEYEEAKWLSKKILELSKEYSLDDIVILARTNAQLQKVETSLHINNIAFDVVDGVLFSEQPEIKLLLSYFRLAMHDNDNVSFNYLYNKPNRWLNKKFFEEVKNNSIRRNTSLYNAMFTIDRRNWRFKNGIDEIFEVINYLQNKKYSSVADLVKYLRQRLDIDTFVSKGKQADDGSSIEQIENLDSFENMCQKYKTIEELLIDIDQLNNMAESNKGKKVKLSTIHRAKGLEFPVVFIIGCNDGLLPHYKNYNTEDEKRLFYVAITRAEKELYLSHTNTYNNKINNRSPFVEDIISTIVINKKNEKDLSK